MFQPHDYIMLLHFYDVSTDVPLPDFLSLPIATSRALGKGVAESLGKFATWGRRLTARLPSAVSHSAKTKTLPSARIWHLGKFGTLPNAGRLALGKVSNFAEC